jgi:hypothetical protein
LPANLDALWRTRHGAIVVGQFAQHAGRFKPCQRHQVDGRFSMTTAGQHAASLSTQRENVPRTIQIGRFGAILIAARTVVTRSAAETPVVTPFCRFNGHGKPVP